MCILTLCGHKAERAALPSPPKTILPVAKGLKRLGLLDFEVLAKALVSILCPSFFLLLLDEGPAFPLDMFLSHIHRYCTCTCTRFTHTPLIKRRHF